MLARYSDHHGRLREILTRPGSGGSVLLIDRDAVTRGDRRLVAHLAADEPPVNAALTCSDYLAHRRSHPCRQLTSEDLWIAPFAEAHGFGQGAHGFGRGAHGSGRGAHGSGQGAHDFGQDAHNDDGQLLDGHNCSYQLLPHAEGIAIPELRWHRLAPAPRRDSRPLSLREVIASLESYQPMRDLTARALSRHSHHGRLSLATLRNELERMDASPIVLNRGLREAVQRALARGDSMSEITIRCGRFKRDARGNVHGDTSWLARRVGLLPSAGKSEHTPWVHSDVLALIARRGLGISPREVELG